LCWWRQNGADFLSADATLSAARGMTRSSARRGNDSLDGALAMTSSMGRRQQHARRRHRHRHHLVSGTDGDDTITTITLRAISTSSAAPRPEITP